MMFHANEPIVLASGSPRRKKYLEDLGLIFSIVPVQIDETPQPDEKPGAFVLRMATEKGKAAALQCGDSWIISGDTVVCLDQKILGKPFDNAEAFTMLMSLAGRTHIVRTGLCLTHAEKRISLGTIVETKVVFSDFDESVARAYISSGESRDKAGAYGIQGRGAFLVESIEGSYTNVVGLPLHELVNMLFQNKVICTSRKSSQIYAP
ncbi:Maf family protein [Desulfomarina sp.]